MSDHQIVTGISILISGYVQLRCGLSVFHWQPSSFSLVDASHRYNSAVLVLLGMVAGHEQARVRRTWEAFIGHMAQYEH